MMAENSIAARKSRRLFRSRTWGGDWTWCWALLNDGEDVVCDELPP